MIDWSPKKKISTVLGKRKYQKTILVQGKTPVFLNVFFNYLVSPGLLLSHFGRFKVQVLEAKSQRRRSVKSEARSRSSASEHGAAGPSGVFGMAATGFVWLKKVVC